MLSTLAGIALGGALVASASLKLARPQESTAAMSTFGFGTPLALRIAWTVAVAAEMVLGVGVALRDDRAAYAAAGLMLLFALTLGSALMRGAAGAPCACFGGGSRVSGWAIGRNLALAAAFAALPQAPDFLSSAGWLTLGLAVSLACAGLAVAVLALARKVGMLRMRLGPAADVWEAMAVPGAPYAIALERDGPWEQRAPSPTSLSSRASSPPPSDAATSADESRG